MLFPMNEEQQRNSMLFWVSFAIAVFSFLIFIALLFAQTYVRWKVNQDFSFLGGFGLESLALLSLGLLLGLLRYKD